MELGHQLSLFFETGIFASVRSLSRGNVGFLDFYQSESSPDEYSEDIASLVLQIAKITSFVWTTQLRQPPI